MILKWKDQLEKVCRICTEFTKMVRRICNYLVPNSDNPNHSDYGTRGVKVSG